MDEDVFVDNKTNASSCSHVQQLHQDPILGNTSNNDYDNQYQNMSSTVIEEKH